VTLYRCTTKTDTDLNVAEDWDTAIDAQAWRMATKPNKNTIGMTMGGLGSKLKYWNVRTTTFVLKPGHKKTFRTTYKGCVDFGKHIHAHEDPETNPDHVSSFIKGISENWVYVAKAGPGLSAKRTAGGTETRYAQVGMTNSNSLAKAIVIETKEVFKCMQPANTEDAYEGNAKVMFVDYPYNAENYTSRIIDKTNEILFNTE